MYAPRASAPVARALRCEPSRAPPSRARASAQYTSAKTYAEMVVGKYNVLGDDAGASTWRESDAVFRVGIGSSSSDPKDGLTVYKDGSMYFDTQKLVDEHGNSIALAYKKELDEYKKELDEQAEMYEKKLGELRSEFDQKLGELQTALAQLAQK